MNSEKKAHFFVTTAQATLIGCQSRVVCLTVGVAHNDIAQSLRAMAAAAEVPDADVADAPGAEEEPEEAEWEPTIEDVSRASPAELAELLARTRAEIAALEGGLEASADTAGVSAGSASSSSANGGGGGVPEGYELALPDVPAHAVPVRCDVREVRLFDRLRRAVPGGFDVVTMDPPWQLASSAPTRGVALGYSQLPDKDILNIPVPSLQRSGGLLFVWVINARYAMAVNLFREWGYEFIDDIAWVKSTVNRRLAKGHGYYLQHAKESCLVGRKLPTDDDPQTDLPQLQRNVGSDVIFSDRRGQSQKPEEIYELIERLVPGGKYLEIFARRNNLRNNWVSLGLEL
jgi:mRNA m6A methyltransferase catalytic subunit